MLLFLLSMPSKVLTSFSKQWKKTLGKASVYSPTQKRKALPYDPPKKACTKTVSVINDINSTYSDIEEDVSLTSSTSMTPSSPTSKKVRAKEDSTFYV
jgi:hypothetical protein